MPITRRILKVGTPTAVEQLAFDVGLFVFLRMVSQFGTEAVSAYMIGVRILGFSFIPGLGFSMAASTLVGQYLGARQPEEAARAGWRAVGGAMGIMTALGLLIIMPRHTDSRTGSVPPGPIPRASPLCSSISSELANR